MNPADYFVWSMRAQTIASALRRGPLVDDPFRFANEIITAIAPGAEGVFAVQMRPAWLSLWTLLQPIDDVEYLRDAIKSSDDRRRLSVANMFERLSKKLLAIYEGGG